MWEIARKTPEGVTCGVCRTEKGMEILEQYGRTLGSLDRPILQYRGTSVSSDFLTEQDFYNIIVKFQYNGAVFDRLFFTDPFASEQSITALADSLKGIMTPQKQTVIKSFEREDDKSDEEFDFECPLSEGWKVIISQKIPCHGQLISRLISKQILTQDSLAPFSETLDKMEEAEEEFFGDRDNPLFTWDLMFIANAFRKRGFHVKAASKELIEKRRITINEIEKWFNPETSAYGAKINEAIGTFELQKIVNLFITACDKTLFEWKSEIAFLVIEKK